MSPRTTYILIATVLQIVMVVAGHYSPAVIALSAILGVGIPFVVGAVFGASAAASYRDASVGGFLIGIVGAAIGILVAILLGDQPWSLLAFGPISSAVTGLLGALILFAVAGNKG